VSGIWWGEIVIPISIARGIPKLVAWPRLGLGVAAIVAAIWGCQPTLPAADLYWSGTGTWNTTTTNWGTSTGGPYDAATWSNTTPDSAIFEGTAGTVTLGGAITAGGLTFAVDGYTVTGNTLTLSGTPTIAANANATIASTLAGSAALTKSGTGTLTLSGANNSTGGLTVNGGTFAAASLGSGPLVVNSGARVSWTNSSYADFSVSAITLDGGVLSLDGTTQNAHNFIGRTITLSGGTLTSVNGPAGAANDGGFGNFILNNSTLVVSGAAQSLISTATLAMSGDNAVFNVGETGQDVDLRVTAAVYGATLRKSGLGTMELTRANSYSGGTIVNAGILKLTAAGATGSGAITINGGTLEIATAAFNALGNPSIAAITINAGGTLLAANSVNNAHNLGALTLNGGTLASNGVTSGFGNFVLRNVTTGGSARSSIESLTITIGGGANAFTVNDAVAGTDLLVSAAVLANGTAGIAKAGAGTMELTGSNTYTGGTTISAGTLKLSGNGSAGSGGIDIAAAGTLEYARSQAVFLLSSHVITGQGTFVKSGSGLMYFRGETANTNVGVAYVLNGGTVLMGDNNVAGWTATFGSLSGNAPITPAWQGTGAFVIEAGARNEDTTFSGTLLNAYPGDGVAKTMGLTKVGTGSLELTGTNTYTGGTTISAGTLIAGNASALGTAGVSIAGGGTLLTPAGVSVSNTRTLAGGTLGFTSNAAAGTLASLAAGSAGATQVLAPTTAWASGTAEVTYSDVLTLTNTSSIPQVLTMEFNPTGLAQGLIDSLELGWFDPGTSDWVSAIDGNSGGTATFFSGSWAEYLVATSGATPANSLGVYGRDTGGNNVWAVINHNSDFAVIAVPEPTTGMMVIAAGVAAALLRRRPRAP